MKSGDSFERIEPWLSDASDASPELRAFLREADAFPEDAARIERLRQRLGPWLAVTTVPHVAHAPGTEATTSSTLAAAGKACLLALGSGALVVGGGWLLDHASTPPRTPASEQSAIVAPSPLPARLPPPAVSTATEPPVANARPETSSPPPSAKRAAKLPGSLAEEAAALAAAQRALASSPANALALLREHATKFPRGALAEERYVFTIEALVALSRPADARRELARLELSYPGSAHLGRARRLVGIDAPRP